jgi:hypothetical protein
MAKFTDRLDSVRIAAPCPADWDSMYGNERVRFCGQCQLHVYNLSDMSKAEAEQLIGQTEGRLCVRYYKRRDGSIITQNCPVGLRAIKRRLSRIATAVMSSLLGFFAAIGFYRIVDEARPHVMGKMVVGDVYRPVPPSVNPPVVVEPVLEQEPVVGNLVRIDTPKPLGRKLPKRQ